MKSDPAYRHELKYLISYADYALLRLRLGSLLRPDEHAGPSGVYTVRSLYFDDYFNRSYHEKYDGLIARQKYRVRLYNHSEAFIRLERKVKHDRSIYKESVPLTRCEVEQLQQDCYSFLLGGPGGLRQKFYYECTANLMRPRVIVDYEREAYMLEAGDVRITFDRNVRAGVDGLDLFDCGLSMLETLQPGKLVMEIKFRGFLPDIVRMLLPRGAVEFSAVSKYVLSCDKTLYMRRSSF